jgi:hypothetical protein
MKRILIAVLSVLALLSGLLVGVVTPASAAPTPSDNPDDWVNLYTGEITTKQLDSLLAAGVDRRELQVSRGRTDGTVRVELTLAGTVANQLIARGLDLERQASASAASSSALRAQALNNDGYNVFRRYGSEGGLKQEYESLAAAYQDITKVVTIGQTHLGQDIIAVKVTRNAQRTHDGSRPATLYVSTQHAREWITPEMNRRLFNDILAGYGNDPVITDLVNRAELWFVPVANPDGYDWTFEPGQRMWRKNLRDNNGDGQITGVDGVDPNRNFPTKWGYDDEGSSPSFTSETYRGPAPGSEPETQALDGLVRRITPEFMINYHSAAELLLYGTGWQVATPTPDDVVYEAMAGVDPETAIPTYDPDISAELYTTNGETTEHVHAAYDVLAFTPEMATCQTASAVDPADEFEPGDCDSVFHFPDSEALVQAEYEKNIPFAIATAQSAADPDDPVSVVGTDTPAFVVDSFDVSYGDPQTVAVTAKRDVRAMQMQYSINGGRVHRERPSEWLGGDRYGEEGNVYYAEYRAQVEGARPGDTVEVWFEGVVPREGRLESEHFTYTVASDTGAPVLVIANEDYTGVNPTYPASVTAPKYAAAHQQALTDAGYASDLWDVDAQGVPHPLGVLSHYQGVLWYLGDNRLTMDPEDELTSTFLFGPLPDLSVAERQQYLTIAVRDFLNEGGRLVHAGETTGYYGLLGGALGGIYYGLDSAPEEDCVVTSDFFSDCLLLSDDFTQYYLGAFARTTLEDVGSVEGTAAPFEGASATFGGSATVDNPLDEAGNFTPLSNVLDPAEFPQFGSSHGSSQYVGGGLGAFEPVEGEWYVGTLHQDQAYMRLARTIDLTGASSAQLQFQVSFNTELGYDNVIVEAHTVGQDNWTTLPDLNGGTSTTVPTECEAGFLLDMHPWLLHYLTPGNPCAPTGTTGTWNAFTGDSDGWQPVAVDLSAYAGQQVEVSISYVTDPASGGVGVFIDDTRVVIDGVTTEAEGFETGLGPWSVPGPPPGSDENASDFQRAQQLLESAASLTTGISILLGYGLEQIASPSERADIVGRAFDHLLG